MLFQKKMVKQTAPYHVQCKTKLPGPLTQHGQSFQSGAHNLPWSIIESAITEASDFLFHKKDLIATERRG